MQYPVRKPNRLAEYDYSSAGAYFITVCAYNRKCIFWKHCNIPSHVTELPLSNYGMVIDHCIREIPNRYPDVSVDKYAIMPNHIHMLLQIHADANGRQLAAPTIQTVVGHMKRAASMAAHTSIWQKGFHDHIIRSESDYLDAWNYIDGNPSKWFEDDLYIPS